MDTTEGNSCAGTGVRFIDNMASNLTASRDNGDEDIQVYHIETGEEISEEGKNREHRSHVTPSTDCNSPDQPTDAMPDALPQANDGGCASAANVSGLLRNCKTKCDRSRLLRGILIAVAVAALLGGGVSMYRTASTANKAEAAKPADSKPPSRSIQETLLAKKISLSTELMTTAAFAMVTPAPPDAPPAPLEVSSAPLEVASAPREVAPAPPEVTLAPKDDSCGTGYKLVGGALIRLAKEMQSHHYAMAACKKEGATLAMPKTEELDVALRNLVKTEGGNKDHWIGLEERGETCSWYWADGSKVDSNQYKGWYPGRPDNPRYFGCFHTWCARYWSGDTASHDPMWDDTDCWRQKSFIYNMDEGIHDYHYIDIDDEVPEECKNREQRSHIGPSDGCDSPDQLTDAMPDALQQANDGGCASTANVSGLLRNCKTKCNRSRLLRGILIAVAVAALLGGGLCIFMYLTGSTANKQAEAAKPADSKPPSRSIKESRFGKNSSLSSAGLMTTAAFAMASPAPSVDPPAPPEVAPAPLDVATAPPEGIGKSEVVGTSGISAVSAPKDDSCGTGYKLVGGALIRLAKEMQSHHYAMAACKKEGATLAMPKTEELDVALRNLVKTEGGNKDHWIGLEERGETCSWYWVDGSKVDSNQYKLLHSKYTMSTTEEKPSRGTSVRCIDNMASYLTSKEAADNRDEDNDIYHNIDSDIDDEINEECQNREKRSHIGPSDGCDNPDQLTDAMPDALPQAKGGGCASAANVSGLLRNCKTKCNRSRLLRGILIAVAVAALLGGGLCIFMYLTDSTANKQAEAAQTADLKPPPANIKKSLSEKNISFSSAGLMTTAAFPMVTPAPPDEASAPPEVASAPLEVATAPPEGVGKYKKVGTSGNTSVLRPIFNLVVPAVKPRKDNICGTDGYKRVGGALIRLSGGWPVYSHQAAMAACKKERATLAMPKTEELDVALRNLVKTEGGNSYHWIGMVEKKGTWYWVDGSKVDNNQYKMTTTHTVPYLTTTLPEVTTTLMEATATLDVTTIVPEVTTTLPEVTTTLPDSPKIPLDVTTSTSTESTATLPRAQMSTTKGVVKGDVCRVGYKLLVGTCIRLACDEKSHGDALLACQEDGATLAMPKTEELDIALRNLVKTEGGNKDHWIGITKFTRATWKWADGTLLGPEYETGDEGTHGGQSPCTGTDDEHHEAVEHSIAGVIDYGRYIPAALRQPEHTGKPPDTYNEGDGDSDSHTYHYVDRDDINITRQTTEKMSHARQPADTETDSSSVRQAASPCTSGTGLMENTLYVPSALRHGEDTGCDDGSYTCGKSCQTTCNRHCLIRAVTITLLIASFFGVGLCIAMGRGDGYTAKVDSYTTKRCSYTSKGDSYTIRGNNYDAGGDNCATKSDNHTATGYNYTAKSDNYTATGDNNSDDNYSDDNYSDDNYSDDNYSDDNDNARGDNFTVSNDFISREDHYIA
uniref:C-type lectin domain-containing protein n=1 Tax=Branchiostoma floridae TaxID=7739 RepID=C3XPV6_BRAFL|eukprot:XP_002613968.1 hypothetical protein BRAFLDRAFT_67468 [Branchiostoma floridae]